MEPSQVSDLRDFLALLEARNDLRRVGVEVDSHLEVAAITDRVCKGAAGGRALYFERVRGYHLPVLTNLFGSLRRTCWAVGLAKPELLRRRLADELARFTGSGEQRLRRLLSEAAWQPSSVLEAPCQEVVQEVPNLDGLPALHCWPGDGGRFLTQPLVFSRDPDGGGNCGMYRVQLYGPREATVRWRPGSGGFRHQAAWSRQGKPMPVAIALGGDPAVVFAATTALPDDTDELALAGLLRHRPANVVSCLTVPLQVPAEAEIVIEGLVDPGVCRPEGPFGNHRGCYDSAGPAPLLRVTALTHRRNPLFPATVAGPPPMESGYLAKLGESLLLALLQLDFPQITAINMPAETIFHGVALLAVTRTPGFTVADLARSLWRLKPFCQSRLLVFFDDQTDVNNARACFWRAVNRVDPQRDLLRDGERLAIDATRLAGPAAGAGRSTQSLLRRRWKEYGLED